MPNVRLNCEYTVDGERQRWLTIGSFKDGADYIAEKTKEIKKENPTATDIVVTEPPRNEGYPYAVDALIDFIMERRPDLNRTQLEDADHIILTTARDEYERGAYILSLPEAKKVIDDPDSDYNDWVYIRELGAVIFDVTKHTSHEIFLTHWFHILTALLPTKADFEKRLVWKNMNYEDAESFLHAKLGFYATSAYGMGHVLKSSDMKLTAQEKMVFAACRFKNIDPE